MTPVTLPEHRIGGYVAGGTSGSVPFVDTNLLLAQDNAAFFWDASNARLGLGVTSPGARLQVSTPSAAVKGILIKGFASQSANLMEVQNSSSTVIGGVDKDGKGFFGIATPYGGNQLSWGTGGAAGNSKISFGLGVNMGIQQCQSRGSISSHRNQFTSTGGGEEVACSDQSMVSGGIYTDGLQWQWHFRGNWGGDADSTRIRVYAGTNGTTGDPLVFDTGSVVVAASANASAPVSPGLANPMYGWNAYVTADRNGGDLAVCVRFDCGDPLLTATIPNCETSYFGSYDLDANPVYVTVTFDSASAGTIILQPGSVGTMSEVGDYTTS